jgi:hypothetical protein
VAAHRIWNADCTDFVDCTDCTDSVHCRYCEDFVYYTDCSFGFCGL